MTATFDSTHCFVCERMRERKPSHKEQGQVQDCVLCNRDYCESHKSADQPGVCEINHHTYYKNHPDIQAIYPSLELWEQVRNLPQEEHREAIQDIRVGKFKLRVLEDAKEMGAYM